MDGRPAIEYVIKKGIPGDLVECGVESGRFERMWIEELQAQGCEREIYMYDTFGGLTKPDKFDYAAAGAVNNPWVDAASVAQTWEQKKLYTASGEVNGWCYCPLERVRANLLSTGYPESRLHFVVGDVAKTLTETVPDQIAVLRLDTDWYESSKIELEVLYDRVTPGGIVIFDDYYYWDGQRRATDEFFQTRNIAVNYVKINSQTAAMFKP